MAHDQIEEIFPDFPSALKECGGGYDDPIIAKVAAFKMVATREALETKKILWPEQFTNTLLGVGAAAAGLSRRPLRVLDFGGGCGVHYFAARTAFETSFRWAFVESQIMASHARTVAGGAFEAYDQIAPAASALGGIDLVHASSAIQYVPEPEKTLDALIGLGAPYFLLARLPIWRKPRVVGVQVSMLADNGFGPLPPDVVNQPVKYPVTFVNFDEVNAKFEKRYRLVLALRSPSADYRVLGDMIEGVTVIFRRKDLN